jgi:hypothetical protein
MPVFSCTLQLNTDFAQRVYKRSFDRLKADLYVLTVRTRSSGMDEAAKAIETIISEAFASARKDLESELERSDALLDDVKLSDLPEYEGALTTKAKYSTPRAKEYLDLLQKMDQLLMRYDALWLAGHIETQPRVARSQNWQRRMIKIANRLRELGIRTRASMTREADKRNAPGNGANGATFPSAGAPAAIATVSPADPENEDVEAEDSGGIEEVPAEFRDPADLSPEAEESTLTANPPAAPEVGSTASESDAEASAPTRTRRRRVAADVATG